MRVNWFAILFVTVYLGIVAYGVAFWYELGKLLGL